MAMKSHSSVLNNINHVNQIKHTNMTSVPRKRNDLANLFGFVMRGHDQLSEMGRKIETHAPKMTAQLNGHIMKSRNFHQRASARASSKTPVKRLYSSEIDETHRNHSCSKIPIHVPLTKFKRTMDRVADESHKKFTGELHKSINRKHAHFVRSMSTNHLQNNVFPTSH